MTRLRKLAILVVAIVVALAALYTAIGHRTPGGQPPLVKLNSESFADFKAAFNGAADSVRVVLLLSPT